MNTFHGRPNTHKNTIYEVFRPEIALRLQPWSISVMSYSVSVGAVFFSKWQNAQFANLSSNPTEIRVISAAGSESQRCCALSQSKPTTTSLSITPLSLPPNLTQSHQSHLFFLWQSVNLLVIPSISDVLKKNTFKRKIFTLIVFQGMYEYSNMPHLCR